MGIFDELDKRKAKQKATSSGVFAELDARKQPSKTLDTAMKVGSAVTDFFGGKAVVDTYGAEIAKAKATPEQKKYITQPTVKQTVASGLELGGNIVLTALGAKAPTAIAKGAQIASKSEKLLKLAKISGEGAAFMGAQSGLRSVQNGNDVLSKETGKETLKGAAIGAVAGPVLDILGEGAMNLLKKKLTPAEYLKLAEKKAPYTIPDAGTPPADYVNPKIPLIESPKIQLPDKGILEGQSKLRDGIVEVPNPNYIPSTEKSTLKTKAVSEAPIVETGLKYTKQSTSIKGDTVSKAASDINKNLVEEGFNKLPDEELARYNKVSRNQQVNDITNLMGNDIEGAKNMALTGKGIPKEIDPQILFNSIKAHANEIGDVNLQMQLAKSPIASQRSVLAQKLGAAATLNDPGDAVEIMTNLNKELSNISEKKLGKPITQATQELVNNAEVGFKTELKKITSKQSVADFINSIPDC